MLRLLKWVVVLAALAAVVAFVPVGGRTLLARWEAARSPSLFLARGWAEIERSWSRLTGRPSDPHAPAHPQARAPTRPVAPPPIAPPVERHTDADRSAVDAIVAEHAR